LFLLPALNLILVVATYLVSQWFHRTQKNHPFIVILLAGSAFTALLFLVAVLFILSVS